ncbi:unnamed protein product, partial [Ectocarpus sp. 13 AM-2016]
MATACSDRPGAFRIRPRYPDRWFSRCCCRSRLPCRDELLARVIRPAVVLRTWLVLCQHATAQVRDEGLRPRDETPTPRCPRGPLCHPPDSPAPCRWRGWLP